MSLPSIALIPARAGSKGLRNKNLYPLRGRPLLQYTIDAAVKSGIFNSIWVSSDSEDILRFAEANNVKAHRRPAEFAQDESSSSDVVLEFLHAHGFGENQADAVLYFLQPTSPLRNETHIQSVAKLIEEKNVTRVLSVSEIEADVLKSFLLDQDGKLKPIMSEKLAHTRRQDLPKVLKPNGALYTFKVTEFLKAGKFPSAGSFPFLMTANESIDIDDASDIITAENALEE